MALTSGVIPKVVSGGSLFYAHSLRHTTSDDIAYDSDFVGGVLKTPRFQIPAGSTLTGLRIVVEVRGIAAGGGSFTLKVGRPTIRKVV